MYIRTTSLIFFINFNKGVINDEELFWDYFLLSYPLLHLTARQSYGPGRKSEAHNTIDQLGGHN